MRHVLSLIILIAIAVADAAGAVPAGRLNALPDADKLAGSHISNAQQDSDGFMWFATWNGLLRYDGHRIHTFRPIQLSDGTIDSNRIYNIKINSEGDIWCVSSDNRLFLFRPDSFTFVNLTDTDPALAGRAVKSVTPLRDGHTWILFRDGASARLSDSDPTGGILMAATPGELVRGATKIRSFSLDDSGHEWVLTDRGALNHTRGKLYAGDYIRVESPRGTTCLITSSGSVFMPGSAMRIDGLAPYGVKVSYTRQEKDYIVMATDRGIYSVNITDGSVRQYSDTPAIYLSKDSRRRIWGFGDSNTVWLIGSLSDASSVSLASIPSGNTQPLRNPQLITESVDGTVILKPRGGVLSAYDEESRALLPMRFGRDADTNYAPDGIKKYLTDSDGNLWVFHQGGTDCLSFHGNLFGHEVNTTASETRALAADSHGRLWTAERAGKIRCGAYTLDAGPGYVIRESPDSAIWIGTKGNGLYILTPTPRGSYETRRLSRGAGTLYSDSIYDIAFGPDGRAWLGSYGNGIAVGTRRAEGWRFTMPTGQPAGMKVRNIHPTRDGLLVIGTADGLVTTDAPRSATPTYCLNRYSTRPDGLRGNDVMGVMESHGRYYICVYGDGICRIESGSLLSDSLRFSRFPLPPAAGDGEIKGTVSHGDDLWVVSDGALTRFSVSGEAMTTFTSDDFGTPVSFAEGVPASLGDTIIVGTSDGILRFSPGSLPRGSGTRKSIFTGILYQNDMEVHPLSNPDALTLAPDRRSFSILLSDMDYARRSEPRTRYRLDGLEEGWNYTPAGQGTVTYNDLPTGTYRLIVETEGRDGTWTQTGTLGISVTPRFTETWWFRLTVILAAVALVTALCVAVIHYKRLRNALQRKYSLLMMTARLSDTLDTRAAELETAPDPAEADRKFISASLEYLDANIDNPDLVVEDMARHLGMSRTAYYNRMKETTGLSPVDFIRQNRIKRSLGYLATEKYSVSEVAYMVGFSDPKYFSRCFKAEMAMTPSQYAARSREAT